MPRLRFAGRANIAADWFEKLGYPLPRGVNQADFFLDLASGDVTTYKINGEDARVADFRKTTATALRKLY